MRIFLLSLPHPELSVDITNKFLTISGNNEKEYALPEGVVFGIIVVAVVISVEGSTDVTTKMSIIVYQKKKKHRSPKCVVNNVLCVVDSGSIVVV
jgi:hypothetical protein